MLPDSVPTPQADTTSSPASTGSLASTPSSPSCIPSFDSLGKLFFHSSSSRQGRVEDSNPGPFSATAALIRTFQLDSPTLTQPVLWRSGIENGEGWETTSALPLSTSHATGHLLAPRRRLRLEFSCICSNSLATHNLSRFRHAKGGPQYRISRHFHLGGRLQPLESGHDSWRDHPVYDGWCVRFWYRDPDLPMVCIRPCRGRLRQEQEMDKNILCYDLPVQKAEDGGRQNDSDSLEGETDSRASRRSSEKVQDSRALGHCQER
ncbi:hypothetical protein T439DRAFT_138981 [Meredithblackwellia eburnea MCA 4105]